MDFVDKIKLIQDNKRLTALLVAIIRAQETGRVTLTREQAEEVAPDGLLLKSHTDSATGNLTLWIEDPSIRKGEV